MSSVFGNARVIWTQDDAPNTWAAFRKTFPVNDLPGQAQLHVAADNKYWLYINGQRIVCEGGLNRESMPGCGYYDTVDIAPYLKKGQNLLAVLAWYWGNSGRNNSDSGLPGLLFSCDELNLYSDASVSAKTHTGFCATQPPHPAYLYGGHNIGFRAENDMEGWQNEEFCACRWSAAIEKDAAKWGELYPRPIPMHRFSEPRPYVKTEYKGNQVIAHLPYAIHAIPLFTLRAPAGKLVDVRTDHYETPGGPGDNQHLYRGHRVEYITKDGLQSFECLNWMFGEKVIYTLEEGVELVDISYRESGYNCDLAGAFSCSDNMLSRLMEKCRRTLYVCMRDNYMDCPDRNAASGSVMSARSCPRPSTASAGRPTCFPARPFMTSFICARGMCLWGMCQVKTSVNCPPSL